MSPKNFRIISHPEPKILTSFLNCGLMDRQMDAHMDMSNSRAVLPAMGKLKKLCCGWLSSLWIFKT